MRESFLRVRASAVRGENVKFRKPGGIAIFALIGQLARANFCMKEMYPYAVYSVRVRIVFLEEHFEEQEIMSDRLIPSYSGNAATIIIQAFKTNKSSFLRMMYIKMNQ